MKQLTGCVVAIALLAIAGCDRYLVTLNERVVSEPPPLFTDFQVSDAALQTCLEQTIQDKEIRRPEDLIRLRCTHAGITDLEGLETFNRLEVVNLADNDLTGIRPLLYLGQLQRVNLEGNPNLACAEGVPLEEHVEKEVKLPSHCPS